MAFACKPITRSVTWTDRFWGMSQVPCLFAAISGLNFRCPDHTHNQHFESTAVVAGNKGPQFRAIFRGAVFGLHYVHQGRYSDVCIGSHGNLCWKYWPCQCLHDSGSIRVPWEWLSAFPRRLGWYWCVNGSTEVRLQIENRTINHILHNNQNVSRIGLSDYSWESLQT